MRNDFGRLLRSPGIRAGLFGGTLAALLSLLSLIPFFGCLTMPVSLLVYFGTGVLAAVLHLRRRPRAPMQGVSQAGFLAGLLTGLIDAIVGLVTVPLALAMTGGSQAIIRQLPVEITGLVEALGLTPQTVFGTAGLLVLAVIVALATIVLATLLATLGSLLMAASRPARKVGRRE
jgi:hypothetical protein